MEYQPKRTPRAQQAKALALLEGKPAFALLMAQRTGKTKPTLDDWGRLTVAGKVDCLLVIAPGGAYKTWAKAFELDVGPPLDKAQVWVWESGRNKTVRAKKQMAAFLEHKGPKVLIMNVEALSSVAEARTFAVRFLQSGKAMAVVDESVCIKSPTAQRTRFITMKLAPLAKVRRILSGLPTPKSPLDLFCQFEFLDWRILGYQSYYAFKKRFAITQPMEVPGVDRFGNKIKRKIEVVVAYRDLDKLQELIAPFSFRCTLEECYDMPPSEYILREVALTEEQTRLYREMKEFATAQLDNGAYVTANQVIVLINKLHRLLCGVAIDEQGVEHEIGERRTASLLSLLEDYDGKAVIWCSYDNDVRKLTKAIQTRFKREQDEELPESEQKRVVARFWGGNVNTREEEEVKFQTDPDVRFMIATPGAGKYGRTWDKANLVVYYSNNYDLDHRFQSEERVKADGKMTSIAYVDLAVPGTVDVKIIEALRKKIDMASVINGDNYKEWLV